MNPGARLVSFGTRPSKYRAIRTTVDGVTFASKAEAARYSELKLLIAHGSVRNLELQPAYAIVVNGVRVGKYLADFRYEIREANDWRQVVEDVKGVETALYRLKAKLVRALYGVEIVLVRRGG